MIWMAVHTVSAIIECKKLDDETVVWLALLGLRGEKKKLSGILGCEVGHR